MPSTSNVLDEALEPGQEAARELDEERKRLERALAELGGKHSPVAAAAPAARTQPPLQPNRLRPQAAPRAAGAVAAVAPAPIRQSTWSSRTRASPLGDRQNR